MHDIDFIRNNPGIFDQKLKDRGVEKHSSILIDLDKKRRVCITELQELQAKRNNISQEIGEMKTVGNNNAFEDLKEKVSILKAEIQNKEQKEKEIQNSFDQIMLEIPNIALDDVPVGDSEKNNKIVRQWGDKKIFDYEPKSHFEIGENLKLMDFEKAAEVSGARFVYLKGKLALLERALSSFMLDININLYNYVEISPPLLVRGNALIGTGQLPKFSDDLFKFEPDSWLIPTAEVPLTNLVKETIIDSGELPLRWTALTPCFRSEAGAAGRDTRGMIRQHQFYKVELVSIVNSSQSVDELERMTSCAEKILQKLNLPYQVVLLSTGDMGFSSSKTYDIEVWLPSQNIYREISSCSLCNDFQSRRMNARYRAKDDKINYVSTLNGSGLAVGRTLVALLENYQNSDGSVTVPKALKPYMGGLDFIKPE